MRKLSALNICEMSHLFSLLGTNKKELDHIIAHPERYYWQETRNIKGKMRPIAAPQGRLLEILKRLNGLLQRIDLPENIHGGICGHSHITNAALHAKKPMVVNNDLKDFFPSVNHRKVYNIFFRRLGCKPDIARYLTRLTTLNGSLPQGSPTSTILSALVIEPIVKRVDILAKKHGATYTQYVDDMAISGSAHIKQLNPLLGKIIKQQGFRLNPSKTKVLDDKKEQVVTGVRVNQGTDIPSDKIKEIRDLIQELNVRHQTKGEITKGEILRVKGKIRYATNLNRGAGHFLQKRFDKILKGFESCPQNV